MPDVLGHNAEEFAKLVAVHMPAQQVVQCPEHSGLVQQVKTLNTGIGRLEKKIDTICDRDRTEAVDIAVLKHKAGVWGLLGGALVAIPALIAAIIAAARGQ